MSVPFHPEFVKRVESDVFLDSRLLNALDSTSPVSIRKNPLKSVISFENELKIAWCDRAYFLDKRINYTLEPLYHAGCFYSQEAGSMLLDHVLKQLNIEENAKILDLCAAPGGKSTLIASFLNGKGLLISNEVINQRAKILKENISKWGYTNCIVTSNDPSEFNRLSGYFDAVVVDAPCSGEGMFRKDNEARKEWSPENVSLCSNRQKRILSDIWSCIKNDGYLIYSTCTFNEQENEKNIEWLLSEFDADLIKLDMPDTITSGRNNIGHYGIPGISQTEGFFIAVVQKKSAESSVNIKKIKNNNLPVQKDLSQIEPYCNLNNLVFFNWKDKILAFPSDFENDAKYIQANFHIIKLGTTIGEVTRKGLIPHHELALNPELLKINSVITLSRLQALKYLHGDTFQLEGKSGFNLVTFNNEPLGWIKHLGNRFNNLYTKEWRIRMDVE